MSATVTDLRVEHGREALGLGTPRPRLSWRLDAPAGWRQASVEVALDAASGDDDHGRPRHRRPGARRLALRRPPLARPRARSASACTGADGSVSPWSTSTPVETGLLQPTDWTARPVGGAWAEEPGTDRRPSRVRRAFRLDAPVASARLYATAHGVFEAELNGLRVGDDELSPGWTSYDARLRYRTHDVTDLLAEGDNVLGAWLGDGWYRGRLGFNGGYHDLYGDRPRVPRPARGRARRRERAWSSPRTTGGRRSPARSCSAGSTTANATTCGSTASGGRRPAATTRGLEPGGRGGARPAHARRARAAARALHRGARPGRALDDRPRHGACSTSARTSSGACASRSTARPAAR